MKQKTLASLTYQAKQKRTRREKFLAKMDQVVPWVELIAVMEPHYPKAGRRGREQWRGAHRIGDAGQCLGYRPIAERSARE